MSNHLEASGSDRITELFIEISQTMGASAIRPPFEPTTQNRTEYDTGSPLNSLYSGMPIEPTTVRGEINRRLIDAHGKWQSDWQDTEEVWEADAVANSINELPGIEVLQSADHIGNNNNRGAHYVFGEHFGEQWAMPEEDLDNAIWNDTTAFLRAKGYEPVTEPEAGDIAVYSFEYPRTNGLEWVEHFAVLEEDGRAVSRFGQGPVVRHLIHVVPSMYGDKIYFFRKATADSEL